MGVSAHPPGRKAEALAFVTERLLAGVSPSMPEVAAKLGVSKTRAKALIGMLEREGKLRRLPGAQRAITIPGLIEAAAIERLRLEGWRVNEDLRSLTPPPDQRPGQAGQPRVVAVIEHVAGPGE